MRGGRRTACGGLVLLAACTLPPLRGVAEIGKDPYAVFVAKGTGGTDLYVARSDAATVVPLTFTPVSEFGPVLSPDGGTVAFLRQPWPTDTAAVPSVWLVNLLSGAERELALPRKVVERPQRVGWSADGSVIFLQTDLAVWRFAAPPAEAVPGRVASADLAAADSAFMTLLGDPAFARAEPCEGAEPGICAVGREGRRTVIDREGGVPAARWGPDSIAYVTSDGLEVRPLGPGRSRIVEWRPAPVELRELTFFPGR